MLRLSKRKTARRQLETAVELYFHHGDDVAIHTLVAAAYGLVGELNEHRGGEPMLKDLHVFLNSDEAKRVLKYASRSDIFIKHSDKDPNAIGEVDPRWSGLMLWEACRKYCELTGELNKALIAYVFWFVAHLTPEQRAAIEEKLVAQGFSTVEQLGAKLERMGLPLNDRTRCFRALMDY